MTYAGKNLYGYLLPKRVLVHEGIFRVLQKIEFLILFEELLIFLSQIIEDEFHGIANGHHTAHGVSDNLVQRILFQLGSGYAVPAPRIVTAGDENEHREQEEGDGFHGTFSFFGSITQ